MFILGYLEEGGVYFTKVETKNNKTDEENEDNQIAAIVSDLVEEKSK